MAAKFSKIDLSSYLRTESDTALFLDACFELSGDDAFIASALRQIELARGLVQNRDTTALN
jgi:DNA-binding phage protein